MSKRRYSKAADDFRTVLTVIHKPTGTTFRTDGNRVAVEDESGIDEINTCDYQNGGNKVRTVAQLRAVAASYLNEQEAARNER